MSLRDQTLARGKTLSGIRNYFRISNCTEVHTDSLTNYPSSSPFLKPLRVEERSFLRSSPEVDMQMLIWSGSGDIYQIGSAFRKDESGKYHAEEFILLEWYRTCGLTLMELIDEMVTICLIALPNAKVRQLDYFELFLKYCTLDLNTTSKEAIIKQAFQVCKNPQIEDEATALDCLVMKEIIPQLEADTLHVISRYSSADREYARLNKDQTKAMRAEIWYNGVEIANGCLEIQNAAEYISIHAEENKIRLQNNDYCPPLPEKLIQAMQQFSSEDSAADYCGAALGLSRLLMLQLNIDDIEQFKRYR